MDIMHCDREKSATTCTCSFITKLQTLLRNNSVVFNQK